MKAARRELALDLALVDRARHVVVELVRHVRIARAVNQERQGRIAVADADDARALLAESIEDDLGAIGPYIAPVELKDGRVVPGNLRERIRVKGLTIELLPVPA